MIFELKDFKINVDSKLWIIIKNVYVKKLSNYTKNAGGFL